MRHTPEPGYPIMDKNEISTRHAQMFYFMCVFVCLCVCLPHEYIYVWRPEESAGSPEGGIQAVMILGTEFRSSERALEC